MWRSARNAKQPSYEYATTHTHADRNPNRYQFAVARADAFNRDPRADLYGHSC